MTMTMQAKTGTDAGISTTGALRIVVNQDYPGRWTAVSSNYDGPGDILGTGTSSEEAVADFCETYADHEVVQALTQAYAEISTLEGSVVGPSRAFSSGFNTGIEGALELLVKLGAKPPAKHKPQT
jgi:hypothetical protein